MTGIWSPHGCFLDCTTLVKFLLFSESRSFIELVSSDASETELENHRGYKMGDARSPTLGSSQSYRVLNIKKKEKQG